MFVSQCIVRDLVGERMSQQPQVTVLRVSPAGQLVTYEDPILTKTKTQDVSAWKFCQKKFIARRLVCILGDLQNFRGFVGDECFESLVAHGRQKESGNRRTRTQ